jgi:HTH-type transcriptional regulator, transcriptional repressor of NAD biosynthesis genes
MVTKKRSTGMVLGKFMPPHLGHIYLVDFARSYVDDLVVVVGSLSSEPISGSLRYQWMKELFPSVQVVHLTDENPQYPEEDPNFWQIWQDSLLKILPCKIDYVFASENYGWKLADILEAEFVPVNLARSVTSISASEIRKDPIKNWQFLPTCVRPFYVKKVCIFGPESTGKSTLTSQLAAKFNTVAVPEYARELLESQQGKIKFSDIDKIARGQLAAEKALARQANRLLFCDTDVLLTIIWSETLFNKCPEWIKKEVSQNCYDLYLLTDIDAPWVDDIVRYLPKERELFFQKCLTALESRNFPYIRLSGSWQERFGTACQAVEKLLSSATSVI